jgi:hypothetical protein
MKSESESLIPRGGRDLAAAEGNCAAEMRGGEQPEAEEQSRSDTMLNSIRRAALASLLRLGEACRKCGDDDRPRGLPMVESSSAGRDWSGNVPKVAWDKWRDPQGRLRPNGSQSVRSSDETGNDGGAKGRRKANAPSTRIRNPKRLNCPQGLERAQNSHGSEPEQCARGMLAALVRGVVTGACTRASLNRVRVLSAGHESELADWRAGCGRPASPVRREGWGTLCPIPTPISHKNRSSWAIAYLRKNARYSS